MPSPKREPPLLVQPSKPVWYSAGMVQARELMLEVYTTFVKVKKTAPTRSVSVVEDGGAVALVLVCASSGFEESWRKGN